MVIPSFFKEDLFQKGHGMLESKKEASKVVFFIKML